MESKKRPFHQTIMHSQTIMRDVVILRTDRILQGIFARTEWPWFKVHVPLWTTPGSSSSHNQNFYACQKKQTIWCWSSRKHRDLILICSRISLDKRFHLFLIFNHKIKSQQLDVLTKWHSPYCISSYFKASFFNLHKTLIKYCPPYSTANSYLKHIYWLSCIWRL